MQLDCPGPNHRCSQPVILNLDLIRLLEEIYFFGWMHPILTLMVILVMSLLVGKLIFGGINPVDFVMRVMVMDRIYR